MDQFVNQGASSSRVSAAEVAADPPQVSVSPQSQSGPSPVVVDGSRAYNRGSTAAKKIRARGQKRQLGQDSDDPDDPPVVASGPSAPSPPSSATGPVKGKLKVGDHLIYHKGGTHFPALVEKCCKRMYKVKKMAPIFRPGESPLWSYEAGERTVEPKEIDIQ